MIQERTRFCDIASKGRHGVDICLPPLVAPSSMPPDAFDLLQTSLSSSVSCTRAFLPCLVRHVLWMWLTVLPSREITTIVDFSSIVKQFLPCPIWVESNFCWNFKARKGASQLSTFKSIYFPIFAIDIKAVFTLFCWYTECPVLVYTVVSLCCLIFAYNRASFLLSKTIHWFSEIVKLGTEPDCHAVVSVVV